MTYFEGLLNAWYTSQAKGASLSFMCSRSCRKAWIVWGLEEPWRPPNYLGCGLGAIRGYRVWQTHLMSSP